MTKHEFLTQLRNALEGKIPAQEVEENVRYYDSYFRESSKSEKEVCSELGDPRLIARTLIDSFVASKGPMADYYTKQARDEYSRENHSGDYNRTEDGWKDVSGGEKWYDKLFRYIMIASVAVIVGALLIGILRFAVRVVIPVLAVLLLFRLVMNWADGKD